MYSEPYAFLGQISEVLIQLAHQFESRVLTPIFSPAELGLRRSSPQVTSRIDALLGEPHTISKSLPLMNPYSALGLVLVYLLIVLVGVVLMLPLRPFRPKMIQIMHNFTLLSISAFMVAETVRQWYLEGMGLVGNSMRPGAIGLARIISIFYLSKILEFGDTFIMVLKKSYRQISFLHLYHHASIFLVWFYVVYRAPGGEAYLSVILNSFIHVILYGYYLSTSLHIPLTFIKPYITSMQMLQFCLMMAQALYDIFLVDKRKWDYPVSLCWLLATYMVTMLALFANFFVKDAQRRRRAKEQAKSRKSQ